MACRSFTRRFSQRNPFFLLAAIVGLVALLAGSVPALASSVLTVPPGLSPGDEYRLVFVTSATGDTTSSSISTYNTFVDSYGDAVVDSDWKVIGSTHSVDAVDNVGTSSSVGIYRLDGTLVATGLDDLFDGSLLAAINIDETGATRNTNVWTGSSTSGVENYAFGYNPSVRKGNSAKAGEGWIYQVVKPQARNYSFYAISGTLTATVIPEPSTALLLGVGLTGLALRRRR